MAKLEIVSGKSEIPFTLHEIRYIRSHQKILEKSVKGGYLYCGLINNEMKVSYFGDAAVFEWQCEFS